MKQVDQIPTAESLLSQGWNFLKNKQNNQAIEISQLLNKFYPNLGVAWYFTGKVALTINNILAAKQSFKNACKLTPAKQPWKITLANVYYRLNEIEPLKKLITSLDLSMLSATEHNQIAMLYSQIHLYQQSIEHYHKAIALEPEKSTHYYSLAAVQRYAGDLEQAEINLTKAIEFHPFDIDAHTLRVDLKKQTKEDNYIESLTALINQPVLPKPLSVKDKVQLYYALAKSYEDIAEHDKSFECLQKGASLRRQHIDYHINQDTDTMTEISRYFDQNWWANVPSARQKEQEKLTPIFILGMPRTGSTLIDQILSAGKEVQGAGELNDFSRLLTEQVKNTFGNDIKTKQEFIEASARIDFHQLGADYLSSVHAQFSHLGVGNKVHCFTDKLPFNFLYIGLIQKALPNAKIIHVTRGAMDTCYAVFKTLFQQAYPFSYDQKELAQYFASYQKLMAHWQKLPQLNIHTINYEQLVERPEDTAEELYQFCDLNWRAEYTNVQNNNSAVTTASASQIRQPIHKGSVQKWRKYHQQLAPLIQQLEQEGISCD